MQCPRCKTEHLVRSERSGIANDYCPKCRLELEQKQREMRGSHSTVDTRPPVPPNSGNTRHGSNG